MIVSFFIAFLPERAEPSMFRRSPPAAATPLDWRGVHAMRLASILLRFRKFDLMLRRIAQAIRLEAWLQARLRPSFETRPELVIGPRFARTRWGALRMRS